MNVLLLSTTDISGGAGIATYRLHCGLRNIGINSKILVRDKKSDDKNVIASYVTPPSVWERIKPHIERLPFKLYPHRQKTPFYFQWNPGISSSVISSMESDIVHLHWICGGFLRIETLSKIKRPILWTLHDMWAFTGGCNHSWDCNRYKESCGKCPQLGSTNKNDLSHWVWKRKKKSWENLNLSIVTPSHWLAQCAKESSLFHNRKIEVIPNGVDLEIYKPVVDRYSSREILNLSKNKKIMLFGGLQAMNDPHKGFKFLQTATLTLKKNDLAKETELIIFGNSKPNQIQDIGLQAKYLGYLNDDSSMAHLYAASDLFVLPSVQDNLPNTVIEALSCGTPCVAFKVGGMPDMIDHKQNGYLAQPKDAGDLADGIAWVLEDKMRWQNLSHNAREKVEKEFDIRIIANRYIQLYEELIL